jgi:two-component system CheB/CheR fusion protein
LNNKEQEIRSANPGDLVVVGSSAGGIEALSILVSTLPADFPAPMVLAQHLDPNHSSNLDVILQRRTQLPVEVVNASSKLEAGRIYVVPSNRHVVINNGQVFIQADHAKRPRPSVDLLLSTAAGMYGEHLIAVILTGSGSDGAAGAVEVKNAGGTVIVQNPQTARYPSMPLALPPTVIDAEADIEQIGPLIYDLLVGARLPEAEEPPEDVLHSILERVNHEASINFHSYKMSTILRRIKRRMAMTHSATMNDYLEYLRIHPEEVGELVKAFLINVTQFFRDTDAFMYLKNEILPKLIERARSGDRVLRFWTAGCSTGEESYSLAMLLTEALDGELPGWSIKVFATDVDESAIAFARRGIYSEILLKGIPQHYRERFFERTDHGYRVEKALRQMVIFGQQDLSRSAPFPRIDLVICRNVLIYFTPELQDYVLNQFAFSLGNNGYLFLGKAETVRPNQSHYELINKSWKVYRCTGHALMQARRNNAAESHALAQEGQTSQNSRAMNQVYAEHNAQQVSPGPGQLRHFSELLLRFLPIGVVVVDRSYHIITANSVARRLLGIRDIANEQDFLHAVRGIPYTEVRNAIDAVFVERSTITLPEVELYSVTGGNRFVSLSIALMQMDPGVFDAAVISVSNVTEQVQTQRQLESAQTEQAQLMGELTTANKRLNEVNKELLDANEELQVANEELVLTHEELQATIEEFETTNEELQATNEELETNNEELQATNEELETTNEELRARSSELQEMSTMLESERVRLTEMVELAPFYIMVLRGPSLIVEAYNPRYAQLLKESLAPGMLLEEVFDPSSQIGQDVVRLAGEAYVHDVVLSTPRTFPSLSGIDEAQSEQNFVHTIVPSHDASGRVSGVILYSIDETRLRAQEIEEERRKLKIIFEHADMTALALYDAQTAQLIMGSPRYLDIVASVHKLDREQLIGCTWQELAVVEQNDPQHSLWDDVLKSDKPQHRTEQHLLLTSGDRDNKDNGDNQDDKDSIWEWTLTPIYTEGSRDSIRYVLVSGVEITEQVHIRQEMERLNLLKDEFISLASHELRTPLTSIMGNAEVMERVAQRILNGSNGASTTETSKIKRTLEQQQHSLESILHQSRRLNTLIDEMLDIARIHGAQFELHKQEHVELVALVRRVIENQAAVSKRRIELETAEDEIGGTWDDARIEQVLNNLLSNAVKYSPEGKTISVRIERTGREVIVSVHDQGEGISEQQQAHIFDRYYRVRTKENVSVDGLGLGLYIVHEIVALHGGSMWLESNQGEGSTFYFSLPLG